MIENGKDDATVDGDEWTERFRLTSTAKRDARVTAVARSITATAKPHVCQMLGGAAGK
jgi:hypothetical protein